MATKVCARCKKAKDTGLFYANKRMKDGFNTFCIVCHKKDNIQRKAKNRADPESKAVEAVYKKQYRERTVEERAKYMNKWRKANQEHIIKYGTKYRKANKARYNFLCQKRKIDLINRTPKWLTADDMWLISEAYDLATKRTQTTNVEWHVDHIIPLRGSRVSGLHVPLNLQVVTRKENQRKTNKFEVK